MSRRWYCSTTFWLAINTLALVAASSFFLEFTSTGLEIKAQATNRSDRIDALDKLDSYVASGAFQNQDTILLLGSSLALSAAGLADYKSFGQPKPDSQSFLTYSGFRYLDQLLSAHKSDKKIETLCLSQGGNMVSEDLLLLKVTLNSGIQPRLLIILASPRDFLDRLHPEFMQSKLARTIVSRLNAGWDFKRPPTENIGYFVGQIPAFNQRTEIIKYVAKISNKSADKETGDSERFKGIKDAPGLPDEQMRADYEKRYLPIDRERFRQETQSMADINALCKEKHIPLLVVAMPLTDDNLKLLPSDFLNQYRQTLNRSLSPGANFLDLTSDSEFQSTDYLDAVHLRSSGGIKLAQKIEAKLAKIKF